MNKLQDALLNLAAAIEEATMTTGQRPVILMDREAWFKFRTWTLHHAPPYLVEDMISKSDENEFSLYGWTFRAADLRGRHDRSPEWNRRY